MNAQATEILTVLAEKLRTPIEHLWDVLVAQAKVDACTTIFTLLFLYAVAGALAWASRLCFANFDRIQRDDMEPLAAMAWGGFFLAVCVALVYTVAAVPDVVTALTNPEYWALKQILK